MSTENFYCDDCGGICCFADDSTYSCSGKTQELLNEKLALNYDKIANYMDSNRLKLNGEKTHLLTMMTSQARRFKPEFKVSLIIGNDTIETSKSEKMLGGIIHENLKWTEFIQNSKESLIRTLNKRLKGIYKICRVSDFKTRKMIAGGIFTTKLIYLMPLWGGCELFLIRSLQVIQNKVARAVTKQGWYTPTEELLKQCGWMSVNQLIIYHTLVHFYQMITRKSPVYLYSKLTTEFKYPTRRWVHIKNKVNDPDLVKESNLIIGPKSNANHSLSQQSFRWRASKQWNALPIKLKEITSLKKFKKSLQLWIKENISVKATKTL